MFPTWFNPFVVYSIITPLSSACLDWSVNIEYLIPVAGILIVPATQYPETFTPLDEYFLDVFFPPVVPCGVPEDVEPCSASELLFS